MRMTMLCKFPLPYSRAVIDALADVWSALVSAKASVMEERPGLPIRPLTEGVIGTWTGNVEVFIDTIAPAVKGDLPDITTSADVNANMWDIAVTLPEFLASPEP